MNKGYLLATATSAALAPFGAHAADLPIAKAPVAVAPPPAMWAGWYIGLNAGGAWQQGHNENQYTAGAGSVNGTSFIGGGQFGYNFQSGNIVYGFEVDGSWLSGSANATIAAGIPPYSVEQQINWLVTARARLGLAVGNAMVYATGGLAVGGVENSVFLAPAIAGLNTSESETRFGWVIGGGAEGMIARNWTVGLEGLFVDLGKGDAIVPLGGNVWQSRFSNQAVIGRVKVNYKF